MECSQGKLHERHVSDRIAFLIGIPKERMLGDSAAISAFSEFESNKSAVKIRMLSIIRSELIKNYSKIKGPVSSCNGTSLYIATNVINTLSDIGVVLSTLDGKTLIDDVLIEVNTLIFKGIDDCKQLFPHPENWPMLRDLFIMPKGDKVEGIKDAVSFYIKRSKSMPYQLYINNQTKHTGYLLLNDEKLMKILTGGKTSSVAVSANEPQTKLETQSAKVAHDSPLSVIESFMSGCKRPIAVIDCENADPYKTYSALQKMGFSDKLYKVIIVDDSKSVNVWGAVKDYTSAEVERVAVSRILHSKSLVDTMLCSVVCKEHYTNGVDGVILFSSDSDYWSLANVLSDVKFLVAGEKDNISHKYCTAMKDRGIGYFFTDDLYTQEFVRLRRDTITQELNYLLGSVDIDFLSLLESAFVAARARFNEEELNKFLAEELHLTLTTKPDGSYCLSAKG